MHHAEDEKVRKLGINVLGVLVLEGSLEEVHVDRDALSRDAFESHPHPPQTRPIVRVPVIA